MASENPFSESTKKDAPASSHLPSGPFMASVKSKPKLDTPNPGLETSFPQPGESPLLEEGSTHPILGERGKTRSNPTPIHGSPMPTAAWESVLASLPQALVVLDERQRVLFTNRAHLELLGIDASLTEEGMTGWFRAVCTEPDRRAKIISSWHEHIWRNQLTRTYPLSSVNKGLRHIEFRSSLSPEGYMIVMQSDITDDIASDEALRLANLKFRMLFSKAPGGIVVVNQEGLIVEVNQAFHEFAGVVPESLTGKPFFEILNREDSTRLRTQETREFNDGTEPPMKLRFSFPSDQRERPALVTPAYITNELHEPIFKIYMLKPRDVQIMNKLKELSLKAQSLLDAVPDMFVLIDRDGFIVDWSPPSGEWNVKSHLGKDSVGKPAKLSWPALGAMLEANLTSVIEGGLTLRQELSDHSEAPVFTVTLAPFGTDTALALIEKPETPAAPVVLPPAAPLRPWLAEYFLAMPQAVLVVNPDGEIIEANPAACSLLGKGENAINRTNLFQMLSKAPGNPVSFEHADVTALTAPKEWNNLLSVSATGPIEVSATFLPYRVPQDQSLDYLVVAIDPQSFQAPTTATTGESNEAYEFAQSQFRSQLQVITSLYSISPDSSDSTSFRSWLTRLKVLAESMTSRRQIGIVHLLRDIADQVSSVMGRRFGLREIVISGPSALTIDNETASPFGLLVGELMYLALSSSTGKGPTLYIDLEAADRHIILTAKPSDHCTLFTEDNIDHAKVIEVLVDQIRGKISVGVGDGEESHSPSIRISFPAH